MLYITLFKYKNKAPQSSHHALVNGVQGLPYIQHLKKHDEIGTCAHITLTIPGSIVNGKGTMDGKGLCDHLKSIFIVTSFNFQVPTIGPHIKLAQPHYIN